MTSMAQVVCLWCGRNVVQFPSRSNPPHVANDSPLLQPWVWALAQSHGDGHRSLVIPERVLCEYYEDLFLFYKLSYGSDGKFLNQKQNIRAIQ